MSKTPEYANELYQLSGFDPNQPRDEDGKWTDGGGGSVDGSIDVKNFKVVQDTDYYKTPILVDAATGKRVRFEAVQVPGKGWTVGKVVGSKSTGRHTVPVSGYSATYTMHQAQLAADSVYRDIFQALR